MSRVQVSTYQILVAQVDRLHSVCETDSSSSALFFKFSPQGVRFSSLPQKAAAVAAVTVRLFEFQLQLTGNLKSALTGEVQGCGVESRICPFNSKPVKKIDRLLQVFLSDFFFENVVIEKRLQI